MFDLSKLSAGEDVSCSQHPGSGMCSPAAMFIWILNRKFADAISINVVYDSFLHLNLVYLPSQNPGDVFLEQGLSDMFL